MLALLIIVWIIPATAADIQNIWFSKWDIFEALPLGPNVSKGELVAILPPDHCCEYLITQYFTRLSPLFHILHGPTFQKQYNAFNLLNIQVTMPADVNDIDIHEDAILPPSSQPTQMSMMRFKIQLFQLSSKICRHLSSESRLDEAALNTYDTEIANEQQQWDAVFLLDGLPSVLDTSSYAHWCILQLYAHQLYLLLHRPFCKSRGPCFQPTSRAKCISSGAALLGIPSPILRSPSSAPLPLARLRHDQFLCDPRRNGTSLMPPG
ncbi:hypothetical protein BO71DRAFT_370650 [Aspergillus ellipticus CBS 707.79]|uniref:Uncharacterized protein n=1 Tax=Aspergillus ellipticus CBS 707.79 TaxID=1448320 RepID=A0A319DML6_9EURO|nr:hypothetical protein BO71DRAFT_370650 [Aspergillus ellipticus CBS 707.79]